MIAYSVLTPPAPYAADSIVLRRTGFVASVGEKETLQVVRLAPNPSHGVVRLHAPGLDPGDRGWSIFDLSGRLRGRFTNGEWDGTDESGRPVPGGVYFVRPSRESGGAGLRLVRR